jgi:hypothetical protein
MEFIKKHYEKVVLGLVVLGLAVSAALLPFIIKAKKDKLEEYRTNLTKRKVEPLPPLDMAIQDAAWKRAQDIYVLDLTTKHNTFNPVLWQKDATGKPIKMTSADAGGLGAIEVTDIRELFMTISYDGPTANGYFVKVEQQGALKPSERAPHQSTVVRGGGKSDAYVLKEVKGTPENPTELIVEAKDFSEPISIGPGKPFKRVDGYAADLKYKAEPVHAFDNQRVGSKLAFGPANQYRYKIVAITTNSVVLSAESNNKNTPIPFNPSH